MSWSDCVRGGDRLLSDAMICRQCESGMASALRVPIGRIRSADRRDAPAALARAGAIYLATVGFRLSAAASGRAFGRHHSTIAHACRRIEDRCGVEPGLGLALDCLEAALLRRVAQIMREAGSDDAAPPARASRHPGGADQTRACEARESHEPAGVAA